MIVTFEPRDLYGANLVGFKIYWNGGDGTAKSKRLLAVITDINQRHYEVRNVRKDHGYFFTSLFTSMGRAGGEIWDPVFLYACFSCNNDVMIVFYKLVLRHV